MIKLSKRIFRNRKLDLRICSSGWKIGEILMTRGSEEGNLERCVGMAGHTDWIIQKKIPIKFEKIARMYYRKPNKDKDEFEISHQELEAHFKDWESRMQAGDIFSPMKELNDLLQKTYRYIPRGKRKEAVCYFIRAAFPRKIIPFLEKERENNERMVHSYLNDTLMLLNKLGYGDSPETSSFFYEILGKNPELILYRTKGGQFMFKMINTPFKVFTATFKIKTRKKKHFSSMQVVSKLAKVLKDNSDEVFRSHPDLYHTISVLESLLQTEIKFNKEIRDWILDEIDYCLKHLVKSQIDLFDLLLVKAMLGDKNIKKDSRKIDSAFKKSRTIHKEIDGQIFSPARVMRFVRYSMYFDKYFPKSFNIYVEELKGANLDINLVMKICTVDCLGEFPQPLVDYISNYMLEYFEKNSKKTVADKNLIIFLTNATTQKVLEFSKRDELKEKLMTHFLGKIEKGKPNLDLINSYLFCEIQTRNFDSEDFRLLAEGLITTPNQFFLSALTKMRIGHLTNLFVTFSFSDLEYNHPIFQKLCFLVEHIGIKEKIFHDPNILKKYISAIHNIYCKGIFKDIGPLVSEHRQTDFDRIQSQILENKEASDLKFAKEFLQYYLPHILKVMQADQVGEGRWRIYINNHTKHKLLTVLQTLKYSRFFDGDKSEHWEKVIDHFLKESKKWSLELEDPESVQEDYDHLELTRSGNQKYDREKEIAGILKSKGINFKREKKILHFFVDFFITLENGKEIILEYDGFHHFSRGPKKVPVLIDSIKRYHLLCEGYDVRVLNYTHGEILEQKINEILESEIEN